jgi:glyoxylase-like metal-dependent hydrolase (beta-lactamase superfamily II)
MRIHHLNCVSTCPPGGWLVDHRTQGVLSRAHLACHCVLLELGSELVLLDTGLGLRDVADPHDRLSEFFLALVKPELREELTAVRQIERLGHSARDVRHIVLTHLDFDHAGGLDDFPEAQVHLLEPERRHAVAQGTWLDRQRFRPQQWSSRGRWRVYPTERGESWFHFDGVQHLDGLPPELLMVPLIGHTLGHAGIAVQGQEGWLLHAGDAYFWHGELDLERPWCTPGLSLYQTMMEKDRRARLGNQARLRQLRREHGADVTIFSSHDPIEFERLSGHRADDLVDTVPDALHAPAAMGYRAPPSASGPGEGARHGH